MLLSRWRAAGRRLVRRGRRGWTRVRRHVPALRVTGAMLAALGLLSVAVIVGEAQEAERAGAGVSLDDLSDYPTHLTVDRFIVKLSDLTATESYQVTVSSDSVRVGIGACGTRSQQMTVTGVASRELAFLVYACAVGEATVTAEVRRTGASSAEASISRTISVEALPEEVIEASGERRRIGAQTRSGTAAQVGTPGIVPSISFYDVEAREFKVRWGKPSSGGRSLTGFGLLIWIEPNHPPYSSAHVVGASARSHHFTGMDPATTYSFRIHACNGTDSCGYWTNPARTVTTDSEATPVPTATPTPTPRPTPAPAPTTPPVKGAPSFGTVAAADYRFRVGRRLANLALPAASGGNGRLSYSIAPALRTGSTYDLGNGLTFNAGTRTISGTPTAAANRTTYTYTVTDQAKKTAQITVSITVFDIGQTVVEGGVARSLQDATWGVLGYSAVVLREGSISRTDGHQLRLRIPASTGFQFGRTCTWPAAAPTDTTMLESPWVQSNLGFYVVRCALGSGAAVRVEMQVRLGGSGDGVLLYATTVTIKQAWHRHDHAVSYFVKGTAADGSIDGGKLFPTVSGKTPNPELTVPANYQNAADAWQNVARGGVTVTPAAAEADADVVIEGYWNPGTNNDQCGGSVACTYPAGTYPHIRNGQRFAIEDPPQWPQGKQEEWTTDVKKATDKRMDFEHLPRVLMHEFGHTLGLGHSADSDAIMRGATRSDLSDTDAHGLRATYEHHRKDQ